MRLFTDEDQLIEGLGKSDPVSFKIVYRLHWKKLFDIAYHIMGNEADAEDIVQDVFCSLWYRRRHLHIRTALENYLVKAVKYTAFFYLKMQTAKQKAVLPDGAALSPSPANSTEESLFHKELETMVNALLSSLPFKTRQIFSLSRFQGLSYPEIASEMGVSVKTVEYHISKALKKFSARKGLF